jgi:hypothetical protein
MAGKIFPVIAPQFYLTVRNTPQITLFSPVIRLAWHLL